MPPKTDLPHGWLSKDEARALADLTAGKTVLELGAYKGRSTVVMAEVAKYVVSLDRHLGVPPFWPDATLEDYFENVRNLNNVASVVVSNWHDFALFLTPGMFDVVYVDGDHDYVAAERDAVLAVRLDARVVVFHDMDMPQVLSAAQTVFGKPSGQVGALGWYQR